MLSPVTAPRTPAVAPEPAPDAALLVPTPRVPPSPGDLPTKILHDGLALAGLERPAPAARTSRSRARPSSSAGWAPAPVRTAAAKSAATASVPKDLSFLKDPRLSIEEKLMRLLGYLNQKWEKEMQAKLDQIAAGEQGATTKASGSKSKKSGGILGSIASAASGLLGGVSGGLLGNKMVQGLIGKIGGPVLAAAATALGAPALAPMLLKLAPSVLGAVAGAASSAGGGAAAGGTAAASGGGAMSDAQRQQIVLEIQRITDKQKEMFGLVSNILKGNHDLRSSIIGNIR